VAIDSPLLAFGVESIAKYDYLNESVFGGSLTNKGLFLIALAYGFKNKLLITDYKKSTTGPRTELEEQDFALMSAIQLAHTSDPNSLKDIKGRNELAQQFAEGGICALYEWLMDQNRRDPKGDFIGLVLSDLSLDSQS